MSLTIEQVHANNMVAKKWLTALVAEIKALRKGQAEFEALPLRQRLCVSPAVAEVRIVEDNLLSHLESMKHSLQLYFWGHYETAALMSKSQSPAAQFSVYENKLFFSMMKTYCIDDVPYPAKF